MPYAIAIDARKIQDFGIGTYIRHLVHGLAEIDQENHYLLLVRPGDRDSLADLPENFRPVVERAPVYSLRELASLSWRLFRLDLDLYHATHYVLPAVVPTRVVVTNGLTMDSNWNTTGTGTEVASAAVSGGRIWLRANADIRPVSGRQARFSYSTDGVNFVSFGPAFTLNNEWQFFMGYRFGIFNYATQALGAYRAEGLEVDMITAGSAEQTLKILAAGGAQVSWGGPMRIMLARDKDASSDTVAFCEVVGRDPFFLIGRTPNPQFRVQELVGRTVATVSEVPTPWICLQRDLTLAGVDPASITRIPDRSMGENAAALRTGEVDVIQVFHPVARTLVNDGAGHVWSRAADRGLAAKAAMATALGIKVNLCGI